MPRAIIARAAGRGRRTCQRLLIVTGLSGLPGCASFTVHDPATRYAEIAWQGLNAADWATSTNINHCRGFVESGWPGSELFGEHPSDAQYLGLWVGTAAVHYGVTLLLDRIDEKHRYLWLLPLLWEGSTIVGSGITVRDNFRLGLRPFGSSCRR